MNNIAFEALSFGSMEYNALPECGLEAEQHVLYGSGSAEEPYSVRVSIKNTKKEEWQGIIRMSCGIDCGGAQGGEPYFLLPGFMVGTNRGGAPLIVDSKCARLRRGELNFPASPWWMVRADRLSHPVAALYSGERICGIFGDIRIDNGGDMLFCGFGCDIDRGCVYYTLGWENAPWLFTDSHTYSEREIGEGQCVRLAPNEEITASIFIFDFDAASVLDIHSVVRGVYNNLYHEPPGVGTDIRTAVGLLAGAIDEYAWLPEDRAYSGFVFDYGKGYELRKLPSTSWTNGMSVAMPMLLASHRLGDETMREHALEFIETVVKNSLNEASGLPWETCVDGVWSNHGWWFDKLPAPGHTGYICGQTLYSILKCYEAEKRFADYIHDDLLVFVQRVLTRLETTSNGDGEYPYVISETTGAGLCYDSMSSAWCLAAAAYERLISGRREGLDALLHSEQHYYQHYVAKACCYGGPMDIDKQIDSEGVLAYLRAVRCLHEITGKRELIEHMNDAMQFEFTFKFCYNAPVEVPPLNRRWCSCGGSITSVTNPHIHPMSSSIIDELMYLYEHTGDEYIRSRLEDTLGWGLQTFNLHDGEFDFGLKGWMSERFCYSQGLLTERYPDGSPASTWFALMPWASGCILEGLCGRIWDEKAER